MLTLYWTIASYNSFTPDLLLSLLEPAFVLQTLTNAKFRFEFSVGLLACISSWWAFCRITLYSRLFLQYNTTETKTGKMCLGKGFCMILVFKCCSHKSYITSSFLSHDTSCLLCRFLSRYTFVWTLFGFAFFDCTHLHSVLVTPQQISLFLDFVVVFWWWEREVMLWEACFCCVCVNRNPSRLSLWPP